MDSLVGKTFYEAFGTPEIIGPDFCPLHTALGSGELAKSSLRVGEKTYYEVQARPVAPQGVESPNLLVVTVRDISAEVLQRQKLNAIYQAGLELGDLSLDDILQMSVDERIDLLEVEDPALYARPAAVRDGGDPPARQVEQAVGAAAGRGDGSRSGVSASCGPTRKGTA